MLFRDIFDSIINGARKSYFYGIRPYINITRLNRPIGILLMLYPSLWGLFLGDPDHLHGTYIIIFIAGAILMRGAGCVYNDILDRDVDRHVARTQHRPLVHPTNPLPLDVAIFYIVVHMVIGFLILMVLPWRTIILGVTSIGFIGLYPLMKRLIHWPQIFLGFTMNWGCLMGWSAVRDFIGLGAVFMYLGAVLWTIGYDTIYAHQDRQDDARIGVKSSALKLGAFSTSFLYIVYGGALFCFALAGFFAEMPVNYYGGVLLAGGHLLWQIVTLDINDPVNCKTRFMSNQWVGLLILYGILSGFFHPVWD